MDWFQATQQIDSHGGTVKIVRIICITILIAVAAVVVFSRLWSYMNGADGRPHPQHDRL